MSHEQTSLVGRHMPVYLNNKLGNVSAFKPTSAEVKVYTVPLCSLDYFVSLRGGPVMLSKIKCV